MEFWRNGLRRQGRGGDVSVGSRESGRPGRAAASASIAAIPLETSVGFLLRRAQQVHTSLWGGEFNGDLTGPQYALLSALTQQAAIDQGTAGRLASLDKSTAGDVIARLQRNGWLDRERDPSDRRRYLLSLTPPARVALLHITPRVAEIQSRLLEPLAPEDRLWFTQNLARLAYGGEAPEMPPEQSRRQALAMPAAPGHLLRRGEQLYGVHWARRVGSALTSSQYDLLSVLAWNAPIDQGKAGDLASLDKSSTADVMARLARRGLVLSAPDDQDRRRKLVVLTDRGRSLLDEVTPGVARVQQDVVAPLEERDTQRLVGLLRAVAYR